MSELFPFELKTPEDIIRAIDQKMLSKPQIKKAIERYGERQAMEAREETRKQMGIPLEKEIFDSLSRMHKMIDELFEITIFATNEIKRGANKK